MISDDQVIKAAERFLPQTLDDLHFLLADRLGHDLSFCQRHSALDILRGLADIPLGWKPSGEMRGQRSWRAVIDPENPGTACYHVFKSNGEGWRLRVPARRSAGAGALVLEHFSTPGDAMLAAEQHWASTP